MAEMTILKKVDGLVYVKNTENHVLALKLQEGSRDTYDVVGVAIPDLSKISDITPDLFDQAIEHLHLKLVGMKETIH